MISRSQITLRRFPYEEPYHLNLQFEASNGSFSGALNYYCNADDLKTIGAGLSSFPRKIGDKYRYEIGSAKSEDKFAYHFVLQAVTIDSRGHCALQVIINNNGQGSDASMCNFSIPVEAASLNRLGNLFNRFGDLQHRQFIWNETDESLD